MKKIVTYVCITFSFSWIMWGLQFLGQEGVLPEIVQIFGMFGMFGPLVGLLVMIKLDKGSYKKSFKKMFQKAPLWNYLFAIITPLVLSFLAYLIHRVTAGNNAEPITVTLLSVIPMIIIMLFTSGPIEEFGWRGYLLPKLRNHSNILNTILIMGLIHGVWHLPLHFLDGTVQSALPIYEYLIITVAITVSYVFIYEFTKSLIPMIVLHWFSNVSSAIFPYFYTVEGRYALLVFYLLLDTVLLIVLHRRGKSLLKKPSYLR